MLRQWSRLRDNGQPSPSSEKITAVAQCRNQELGKEIAAEDNRSA